jgi:hypothetical protein
MTVLEGRLRCGTRRRSGARHRPVESALGFLVSPFLVSPLARNAVCVVGHGQATPRSSKPPLSQRLAVRQQGQRVRTAVFTNMSFPGLAERAIKLFFQA